MPGINLHATGSDKGYQEFLSLLTEHETDVRKILLPIGAIEGAFTVLSASGVILTPLAYVLVTWLKGRASRKVEIKTPDGLKILTRGHSVEETVKLLSDAKFVHISQPIKDDG
jgi:hypothetical protein